MRIALVFSEPPLMVTGPRNSLTLLANAIGPFFKTVSVYSTHDCKPFLFNNVEVKSLEERFISEYDLFIITGVWWPQNIKLAKKLVKNNIPYIISPRSSLMRSSFKKSLFKKTIYYTLRARTYIKRAAAIHFLTEDEKKNSFYSSKGFVVGNIVNDPDILRAAGYEKSSSDQIIVSFLGRLDVTHKGLDVLFDSIKYCEESLREKNIAIRINGPDNAGNKGVVQALINKLNLEDIVALGPRLSGKEKADFLKNTDIFVHTSRYEGQPQAVMEAMMSGCAILVTPGTNMGTIINKSNSGLVSKFNTINISENLLTLLNSDITEKKRNAFLFAQENFSSFKVGSTFSNKVKSIIRR